MLLLNVGVCEMCSVVVCFVGPCRFISLDVYVGCWCCWSFVIVVECHCCLLNVASYCNVVWHVCRKILLPSLPRLTRCCHHCFCVGWCVCVSTTLMDYVVCHCGPLWCCDCCVLRLLSQSIALWSWCRWCRMLIIVAIVTVSWSTVNGIAWQQFVSMGTLAHQELRPGQDHGKLQQNACVF